MKEIWFIRHGESESNAGLPSQSAASPPLTPKGQDQAARVAEQITRQPDRIIISSYIRTVQTAEPTIARFPNTLVETWPVQEFTYLSHQYYDNQTGPSRIRPSLKYWHTADPDYVDGDQAESFNHFIQRVTQTLDDLKPLDDQFTLIFSHGWFIRALPWVLLTDPDYPSVLRSTLLQDLRTHDMLPLWAYPYFRFAKNIRHYPRRMMRSYILFASIFHLPNTAIMKFTLTPDQPPIFVSLDKAHIANTGHLSSSL